MTNRDPNRSAVNPDRDDQRLSSRRAPEAPGAPAGAERPSEANPPEHEGAAETEVGDRTGPGAGYDEEPEQEKDRGGVS
jgi:hypothetical protein